MTENVHELVGINSKKTSQVADKWLGGDHEKILEQLKGAEEVQFSYLTELLKEKEHEITETFEMAVVPMEKMEQAEKFKRLLVMNISLLCAR